MRATDKVHEIIIVGSGPSGVGAALGFSENGIVPLMLDVGNEATNVSPLDANLYDYRKSNDTFNLMIGENYEVINHVINKRTMSPKISSPYMQFVTKDTDKLCPIVERGSSIIQSFSKGGLANAWGAGLYRCNDNDLSFLPVTASELSPFYDKLTEEIGISGEDDDLTPFFGPTTNLLPPLKLSQKSKKISLTYIKKRKKLNAKGIYIGRSRVGVLSQKYHGREAYKYQNLEMWLPNLPYIYTPSFTLQKLITNDKVIYRHSVLVKSWTRENGHIVVNAENVDNGSKLSFMCKKLMLAAGTINSSKIVLNSKKDFSTRLPLQDNTLVQIPLILPSFIGAAIDREAFALTNLNMVYNDAKSKLRLQGSIIELSSPARAVFFDMLPLSVRDNINYIRLFLPSLMVLFLYFPSSDKNAGYVALMPDDKLEVSSLPYKVDKNIVKTVTRALLSLGILTHNLLAKTVEHSLHYGGTLPMVIKPENPYQCDALGQLHEEHGVHVVDGSLFSYVPSKNFSLTLMANAMRIADRVSKSAKGR